MLTELRIIRIKEDKSFPLTSLKLTEAITVNENLISLGLTLPAEDIIRLAQSRDIYSFYSYVSSLMPEVRSRPMYPDFPSQVMEIDESQFRFFQILHYASTYGVESLTGHSVLKGWLPEFEETKKVNEDPNLLSCKVVRLADDAEIADILLKRVLLKKERMTGPESRLASAAVLNYDISVELPFKENIYWAAVNSFRNAPMKEGYAVLSSLAQNSGDILKFLKMFLRINHYPKLRTSQKRCIVRLIESYSPYDFKENLVSSSKGLERNLSALDRVSFRRFSQSPEHMKIVMKARNHDLRSWYSKMESMISAEDPGVLQFIGGRPGVLIRMVSRLLSLDFISNDDVFEEIRKHASDYSTQTLVSVIRKFSEVDADFIDKGSPIYSDDICYGLSRNQNSAIRHTLQDVLADNLSLKKTPLYKKRIFIEDKDYDLSSSYIMTNDKSQEGGYIQSGISYKIPGSVDRLRFFVYWNDQRRVDLDLHAYACDEGVINLTHIGWDSYFRDSGIVTSGDKTVSDSTEFIDIDMSTAYRSGYRYVALFLHSFTRQSFKNVDTINVGAIATTNPSAEEKNVKLYNQKNCFFYHSLNSDHACILYGFIDLKRRTICYLGEPVQQWTQGNRSLLRLLANTFRKFTVEEYLKLLLHSQQSCLADSADEADIILVPGKSENENELSLIDENFFMDYAKK